MKLLLVAVLTFLLCYTSNFSFSVFYNTKILNEKINKEKLLIMITKAIAFVIGLTTLSIASFLIPELLTSLGIENTLKLSDKTISVLFGTTSLFYAGQALLKLKNIILKVGENGGSTWKPSCGANNDGYQ